MGLTVRYFDTPERYGWYYLDNDTWFYGGSTEEECHKSIAECGGRIVKTVDIWDSLYSTCLQGNIREIGKVDGKTLYYQDLRDKYYFLTDSRYGENYFL